MAKNNKVEISLEEKLKQALVPVDEQPYTIPSNWVWVGLKHIAKKIFAGGDKPEIFSKIKTNENIFPIFSNGIDKDGLYGYTNEARVLEKALTISARGTIGFSRIREANFTPIIRLIVIILKDNLLYEFLDYYLKYNSLEGIGSSIPQLTVPIVNEKIIPLPPLNEQKRIVEKLDFLFEKTKRAKEIIEEVKVDIENRKISILDRAFKGTLTSKWRNDNKTSDVKELLKTINDEKIKKWEEDCLQAEKDGNKKPKKPIIKEVKDMIVPVDEQPYTIPSNWVWTRLGEISKLSGGSGFPEKYQGFLDKNIPFYKVGSLKNIDDNFYIENSENYIDDDILTEIKAKLFPANTIIFAKIGEAIRLNRRAILKENSCIDNNLMALVSNSSCYFRYVYFWLKKEDLYKYAQATTVPSIRQSTLEELEFPLPPLEEQEEIVRVLDEVLENENKVKELLELEERIDILEKSILHKAFKGELGTQNNSDEPALNLLKSIL